MDEVKRADKIAGALRQEPYHLFRNDCLIKSLRLRSMCRELDIRVRLVFCVLGLTRARLPLLGEVTIPYTPHFWGEVQGRRIETSRPLGSEGHLGIVPSKIRPLFVIRFF